MTQSYKGYEIKVVSRKLASGLWSPNARVGYDYGSTISFSQIMYRGPQGFKTQREANACALELAKTWINRRLR